jgi:hypothetical protein
VLTFAVESLDMLRAVTGIFGECLALTLSVDSDDSQSLDPAAVGVRGN